MALFLTVLGCSSATPTSSRHPSAFTLKSSKQKEYYLIDCGEGTQILMRRLGIRMQRVTRVFISHLHGDHYFGLIGFIFTQNLMGRQEELHIYAHKDLEKIIKLHLRIDKVTLSYPLIFHVIKTKKKKSVILYEDDLMEISTFPLVHSIASNGFLFKEKRNGGKKSRGEEYKTFAYCSDTAYTETIIPYIKGVDLLYHEATFMQDMLKVAEEKYHSTAKQAAEIAKLAGVKTLLIGHYSARYSDVTPLLNEAQTVFRNTVAASEGVMIKV